MCPCEASPDGPSTTTTTVDNGSDNDSTAIQTTTTTTDSNAGDFIRGETGVDACPEGYTSIRDAQSCQDAANFLGIAYNADANDGHPDALCNYCGGCRVRDIRLSDGHLAFADWVCAKIESNGGADNDSDTGSTDVVDESNSESNSSASESSSSNNAIIIGTAAAVVVIFIAIFFIIYWYLIKIAVCFKKTM